MNARSAPSSVSSASASRAVSMKRCDCFGSWANPHHVVRFWIRQIRTTWRAFGRHVVGQSANALPGQAARAVCAFCRSTSSTPQPRTANASARLFPDTVRTKIGGLFCVAPDDRCKCLILLVPLAGLEPARCYHHLILSQARLPIPPQGPRADYSGRPRGVNGSGGAPASWLRRRYRRWLMRPPHISYR